MESFISKHTIEDMRQLAALRNGKCLSDKYWNNARPLLWQCEKGHKWEASSRAVQKGAWCPECKRKNKNKGTIEQMNALAQAKGGKCLSTVYVNQDTKLQWQCTKGHIWNAIAKSMKTGHWCPYCAGRIKLTIEEMNALAQAKGGKCLSNEYVNSHTTMEWECKQGHRWKTKPYLVKSGQWCPTCAGKKIKQVPLTIS